MLSHLRKTFPGVDKIFEVGRDRVLVAGGAVVRACSSMQYFSHGSDLDVFFYGCGEQEATELLGKIVVSSSSFLVVCAVADAYSLIRMCFARPKT